MKKKSEETRGGRGQRHFGGAVMLMGAFCVLLSGNPPASAVPLETSQVLAREAPVAAQVLEPLLPADTGPEKSPPPIREPACPREESFADAAFLGDSRTEGLYLYGGSEEGTYLYAVGTTVESVFTKATQETEEGEGSPSGRAGANAESKGLHHAGSQRAGLAANRDVSGAVRQGDRPDPAGSPRHYGGGAVHFARQRRSEGQGQLKRIACI